MLLVLVFQSELVKQLDFDDLVNEIVRRKARKKPVACLLLSTRDTEPLRIIGLCDITMYCNHLYIIFTLI